ncbi:DcrB-related protein [Myxococcus sp. CA033]|uniref:DcrB-related protein n=1 Tax=Myxococcus sp. CA033 TaxID=2741516 RepID=UPI00157B1D8B|nr:DcrB-related protein [Myxococcus sp. CA033]NTX34721.1 DcrB-related protein [Myxococcus sp. CA033]
MSPRNSLRHGALTLSLPEGWQDTSQVIALGPEDGGFRPSVVVSVEPVKPSETAQQLAARMLSSIQQHAQSLTLLSERQVTHGDKVGVQREYILTLQGARIAQLQFCTVKEGMGLTFTFSQREDRFRATRAVGEAVFAQARVGGALEATPPRLGFIRA